MTFKRELILEPNSKLNRLHILTSPQTIVFI